MSNNRIFRIASLTDKQIISLFNELSSLKGEHSQNFVFGNHLQFNHKNIETVPLKRNSRAILSANATLFDGRLLLVFKRGISDGSFNDRIPSATSDEIQVDIRQDHRNTQTIPIEDYLGVISVVEKHTKSIINAAGNDTESPSSILGAELQKLSELATELTIGADNKRRELDSLRDKLQQDFEAKSKTEAERIKSEEKKLEDAHAKLERLRTELDDREHKHVRRELRESITTELSSDLSEPSAQGTALKYEMLAIFFAILAVIGLGFLTYETQTSISEIAVELVRDEVGTISQKPSSSAQVWLLYSKMALTGAAALGLLVYVVTWLRSLAQSERAYKRKLRRHIFDMNRASWTIETILELTDAELEEVPSIWLERVTTNLFDAEENLQKDATSIDALAALLNVTTEAEIGPEGPKFRLNRRAARKAAASADD